MTSDPLLGAISVYLLQTFVVIVLAALLEPFLGIAPALWRVIYWRFVLLGALAMPLVGVPSGGVVTQAVSSPVAPGGPATAAIVAPAAVATPHPWSAVIGLILLLVIGVGALLRTGWLLVGVRRLRMLRRDSAAWLLPQDIVQLRLHLAPHADIRLHDTLEQPVTFGICRPVVLVPRSIDGLRSAEQCAVICHELVHVARRDWISLLSEEGVRSLCWFHPAVRWAIARLQLAREQRVDEIAVAVTADRGAYMRMLIGFASAAPLATPVVAFTRRRDLLARLRLISQEVAMSPIRATFVCLGLLTFLGVTGTGAAFALPVPVVAWQATADRLTASRRFEGVRPLTAGVNLQSADGVTRQTPSVDSPTPRSTVTRIAAVYPAALTPHLVNAVVRVQVTVDAAGQVDDVQLLSARAWPGDASAETAAIIDSLHADGTNPFVIAATSAARLWRFATAADQQRAYTDLSFTFRATGAGGNAFVSAPPPPPPPPPNAASQSRGFVPARGSVRPGEPVPPPPPAPPSPPQPVRVGGNVPAPRKVKDVRPVYPPGAKASGISGVVIAEVWVGVDGTVKNARVLRSVPALDQAALDAVLQWEYEPVLVNGAATDVVMVVTVNFTLTN